MAVMPTSPISSSTPLGPGSLRAVLALTAGSVLIGLTGAGAALADGAPGARTRTQPEYAFGKVVSKAELTVRSRPGTRGYALGTFAPGQKVEILCKKHAEQIDGNDLWYRLYNERDAWVSARYVKDLSPVKWCG
ncbi:SH3 domain-containing protein [Streptomyces sp. G-G2]|uniref:SH3 domain-containing protein n=1 Tax=Streptomyces sp. G-G2 TaxID=3046201 RepID=UPI0024B8D45B|nr:SH3 domain-containing protein [Streptomyces sp. G-G2]MDJ0382746.1 SH3 domain-containing protein [Streptomyces sp. G-G2]